VKFNALPAWKRGVPEPARPGTAPAPVGHKRSFQDEFGACFEARPVVATFGWVIEELVPDGLWEGIAPLLPPPKPRRYRHPGRRLIDDRAALAGIVFVLKTGIAWNQLPTSVVGCSGVTCWRRLPDWTAAVWPALHEQLLAQLRALGELDLGCCAVDGSHVRVLKGGTMSARPQSIGAARAPSTTCSATPGIPLAVTLTAAALVYQHAADDRDAEITRALDVMLGGAGASSNEDAEQPE
jgi:transposase